MLATMADAHREWHRNTGVPVGLPGCPQDACDPEYLSERELRALVRTREINFALIRGEDGDATISHRDEHGNRHVHLSVQAVRECSL